MKTRINPRIPVIAALFLVAGIALGYAFKFYDVKLIWLVATVPAAAIIFVVFALKKRIFPIIVTCLCLLLFFAGFIDCFMRLSAYGNKVIDDSEVHIICGRVTEKGSTSYSNYIIIGNASADGLEIDGKVIVYLYGDVGDAINEGYGVSFESTLIPQDVFPYGNLNYYAVDNVKYSCAVYNDITYSRKYSFFGSIRSAMRGALFNNLSENTAAVCYAMMTGNTQDIENNSIQSFRYGGIAHIFAVSGLHIGIVFGFLNYILKKLRLNNIVASVISLALVFFYCGVCGFTVSSLRAAIMCAVATVAKLIYKKYDGLNALAVAVVVILLITPLSLFGVGFQLSVCAVGGIFVTSQNIRRALQKIRLPEKIASAAGVSLGAQLGVLPIMLANFGYLSGAGLLLNIVFIPVLSVLFVIIFACTIIAVAIAALAPFILPVAVLPLELLISFLVVTSFESALISGFGAGLFAPIYFIGLLAVSDKINIGNLTRAIASVTAVAVLTAYVIWQTYSPLSGFKIIVSAYNGGGEVIIKSSQGTVLIITDNVNSQRIISALNKYYSLDVDGVIILGGEDCSLAFGELEIDCGDVYVCALYLDIQPYENTAVHYERYFSLCGIDFEFVDGYNLLAETDGVTVGVSAGDIKIDECNLLISKDENDFCQTEYTVYFNLIGQNYNVYEYGDLKFLAEDGELDMLGVIPKR